MVSSGVSWVVGSRTPAAPYRGSSSPSESESDESLSELSSDEDDEIAAIIRAAQSQEISARDSADEIDDDEIALRELRRRAVAQVLVALVLDRDGGDSHLYDGGVGVGAPAAPLQEQGVAS